MRRRLGSAFLLVQLSYGATSRPAHAEPTAPVQHAPQAAAAEPAPGNASPVTPPAPPAATAVPPPPAPVQQAPNPGQTGPVPPGAGTPGAQPGAAPSAATPNEAVPSLPEIQDPMLVPTPRPAKELRTWREAVTLVRGRSPTLAVARAQVAQASGRARQVLAQSLPELNLGGNLTRYFLLGEGFNFDPSLGPTQETIPSPATRWQGSLSLRQPVIAFGAWHDHGTAKRTVQSTEFSARDGERRLFADVANIMVNVITTERLSEVSRVNLQSALSTLDLTQRRARLGAAAAIDVLRAEQEVALSRANIVQADEAVRRSRESLGNALGDVDAWGVSPEVDLSGLVLDARTICQPTPNAEQRADIRAAQVNLEIAQRNRDGADLLFAPTLDLVSQAICSNTPNANPNGESVSWSAGLLLNVPLYDGGSRYGVRDETLAGIDVARAELDRTRRQAILEIQQAQRSVSVAQANLEVSDQSRRITRETARLADLSFLHGTGTSFDVVEAARDRREAEIDYVLKQFGVIQAEIAAVLAAANCDL